MSEYWEHESGWMDCANGITLAAGMSEAYVAGYCERWAWELEQV